MIAGVDSTTFGYLALSLALLVFVGGGMLGSYRGRFGTMVRDTVTWLALGFGLVALYAYKDELMPIAARVVGELLPGSAMTVEQSAGGVTEVRIRKRLDGHFVAKTQVNGVSLNMLIDTGASTVVLKPADAQKLGIDVDKLRYSVPVQTANGTTYAAHVRLRSLTLGPISLTDVEALVAKPGALKENLLGMSFLSRLRSYEFTTDMLTLRS
jgi:aspartyl protease family protein